MYDTTSGIRVLYGAEARLFANAAWSLTDFLRSSLPNSGEQSFNHMIGIPVLESLTAAQIIVLVDRATACLLDPKMPAPPRTAVLDATIAAVFQQVATNVRTEIDLEDASTRTEDDAPSARTLVAEASAQISEQAFDPQSSTVDTPDPTCVEMETWQFVIDRLCDRVLPDVDWQLESIAMDLDPDQGTQLKGLLGIHKDYFIDIVPEASVQVAANAWCDLIERISGWRPEQWRFGCGLPRPADADVPPRADILSFSEDQNAPNTAEGKMFVSQQAKPVLLSDVMFEIEEPCEEWSSFVDRKNGEVVGLPSDTMMFVDNGEDPDDYCGEGGKDFLELARRILDSNNFVSLPDQFEMHEWSIMRDFCNTVTGESNRQALLDSVHGSGAFRHFKSTIDRLNLRDQWFCYREVAIEKIVIDWLKENSIKWSRTKPNEPPF